MARCGPARHRPGAAASRRDGVSRRTSVCLTATGRLAPTAGASVKRVDHLRRCADVPPRRGRARRTTRRGPRGPAGPSRSAAPHRGAGGDAVAAGDRPAEPVGRAGAQGDQRTTRTAHRHGDPVAVSSSATRPTCVRSTAASNTPGRSASTLWAQRQYRSDQGPRQRIVALHPGVRAGPPRALRHQGGRARARVAAWIDECNRARKHSACAMRGPIGYEPGHYAPAGLGRLPRASASSFGAACRQGDGPRTAVAGRVPTGVGASMITRARCFQGQES